MRHRAGHICWQDWPQDVSHWALPKFYQPIRCLDLRPHLEHLCSAGASLLLIYYFCCLNCLLNASHLLLPSYHPCKVKPSVNIWHYSKVLRVSLRKSLYYFWVEYSGVRSTASVWLMGSAAPQLEILLTCYVKSKYFEVPLNQILSKS